MFVKRIVIVLALLFAGVSAASAQTPTPMQKFDAWVAYSYQSDAGKVCYVLSVPAKKEPANVDHGDNFFVVTKYPGQNVSLEPQAMMGFDLKPGSKIDVVVDGNSFPMYFKGKGGWLENAAQEPALVNAMKGGRSMEVRATSARGTNTVHTYSLIGITAALNKISACN
ncbi:invasion associated locus B family protein [Martelella sp. HB161492]|uniref:invasion associated locus B family protein n=1 Tax=Martelella sp. HB161492 TaxID=2720726 RepID=UPI00158FB367|nr:invasion associated locus B family protein [Martelella sp. HB161492]